jgi:hypothetical protein
MKKTLIVSICMLWCCGAYAQENQKVAVFDPAGDVESAYKEIVREEISSIIVNTGGFTVLERQLINKVLEENKFQMGGLVDDSQVGEIGKRMGANYVFVTSISPMGQNLYLSFKLIDVQTARIEKQKTSRTTKGSADLVDVTQKVVGEMFVGGIKAAKPAPVAAAAPKPAAKPVVPPKAPEELFKNSILTVEGKDVYAEGEMLSKAQIRRLMANTESLKLYNKGKSRRNKGTALVWTGSIMPAVGFVLGYAAYELDIMDYYTYEVSGNKVYEVDHSNEKISQLTAIGAAVGVALIGTGIGLRISGKKLIHKSVNTYNEQKKPAAKPADLQAGFTQNGIGLVLTF